jgi:hypothetical protein
VVHTRTSQGLEVYVTGDLGFNADFDEAFRDIDAVNRDGRRARGARRRARVIST